MKRWLYALSMPLLMMDINCNWAIDHNSKGYIVYSVERDTMTTDDEEVDRQCNKQVALDEAQALNDAHEHRINHEKYDCLFCVNMGNEK